MVRAPCNLLEVETPEGDPCPLLRAELFPENADGIRQGVVACAFYPAGGGKSRPGTGNSTGSVL